MIHSKRQIDWGEMLVPAVAFTFGALYFFQTRDAPADAIRWPVLTALLTGALWLGVVFTFALKLGPGAKASATASAPAAEHGRQRRRVYVVFLATVGYLGIIAYLGFTLTNILFMLVVFRGLGSRRWTRNIWVALTIALFLHLALVILMKQDLPQLILGPLRI
jgi:hypothetical protein